MTGLTGGALVADLERRFTTDRETVTVGSRDVTILRPRNSDDLITEEDYVRDERLPYWADIWPSSRILARHVIGLRPPRRDGARARCLELGCGAGLVSVCAMIAGYDVTSTDYYDDALDFARANGHLNVGREPAARMVDWRSFPTDLGRYDLVIASDVLYEKHYPGLILGAIEASLAAGGRAIVADPGRIAAPDFLDAAAMGFTLATESHPIQAGEKMQTIALHTLSRRD